MPQTLRPAPPRASAAVGHFSSACPDCRRLRHHGSRHLAVAENVGRGKLPARVARWSLCSDPRSDPLATLIGVDARSPSGERKHHVAVARARSRRHVRFCDQRSGCRSSPAGSTCWRSVPLFCCWKLRGYYARRSDWLGSPARRNKRLGDIWQISLLAGVITFRWYSAVDRSRLSPVLMFDAAGLRAFRRVRNLEVLAFGLNPVMAALLGMVTGIGGGMVRDVLVANTPVVLRTDIYAVAALAGAAVVAYLQLAKSSSYYNDSGRCASLLWAAAHGHSPRLASPRLRQGPFTSRRRKESFGR